MRDIEYCAAAIGSTLRRARTQHNQQPIKIAECAAGNSKVEFHPRHLANITFGVSEGALDLMMVVMWGEKMGSILGGGEWGRLHIVGMEQSFPYGRAYLDMSLEKFISNKRSILMEFGGIRGSWDVFTSRSQTRTLDFSGGLDNYTWNLYTRQDKRSNLYKR